MTFNKLVRYEHKGETFYGDLVRSNKDGHEVKKLSGDIYSGFESSEATIVVPKVCEFRIQKRSEADMHGSFFAHWYRRQSSSALALTISNMPKKRAYGFPNIRNTAANFLKLPVPDYPVIFTKPSDALTGPFENITIHQDAQPKLAFEGELCVVIGKNAKNVSESNALDYVLGYCVGNDVSARSFQVPNASGGQFCYAKSFDNFAPIGPAIWSRTLIPDPHKLKLQTFVNGEKMQEIETGDMIWSIPQIISHLSRGTVIKTGTPSGVGFFRNHFLKNSDIVTIKIEGMGAISNKMVFES